MRRLRNPNPVAPPASQVQDGRIVKRVAVAVLLLALLGVGGCGDEVSPREVGSWAGLDPAMAAWTWQNERASASWCTEHQTGPRFKAELDSVGDEPDRPATHYHSELHPFASTRISIREGSQEKFSWVGTENSVWHVVGRHIYFVDFSPQSAGGDLLAADLDTGKLLWRIPLAGAYLGDHSLWSNSKILRVEGGRIYVWSVDGARFLEIRDRHRVEVVAVRKFED